MPIISQTKPVLKGVAQTASIGWPWSPDLGNGMFKNPVIFADYSDPDVIRAGDDFYLIASSFNCTPGLPILHSKDLVNWTIINHAVRNLPHPRYAEVQPGCGIWAPAIRFHAGKFWVFFPMPDEGIYVTMADDPAGCWSEPHLLRAGRGLIDPCPFWDDDGHAYLVHAYAGSRAGIKHRLHVRPMSPDGSRLLGDGEVVFHQPEKHPTLEGPKLYKRNGYYYIFAPAGGVKEGWQTVLRAKNIFGPYEDRIVLAQGDTQINGPHQGAWVETQAGESWFLHFQDCGAYGRVVHLQPMQWVDDWPVMGHVNGDGIGQPVPVCKKPNVGGIFPAETPQTSDEFDSDQLGLQWQWQTNYSDKWFSLAERPGWLRLHSVPLPAKAANLWLAPNLPLQKFSAPEFAVTAKLDFSKLATGERAGLIVMGQDYSYLAVERTKIGFRVVRVACKNAAAEGRETEEQSAPSVGDSVWLRVKVGRDGQCRFSYSTDGENFVALGKSFAAREGKWIGAKVGLFCAATTAGNASGCADFDFFRFSAGEDDAP
jgi:beta-xylosidase